MISADKRRVGRCGIAIVACMMLGACAAAPTVPAVTSDIDPSVDFSPFRTYRVLDSDVRDADQHLGADVERMIVAAIEREMHARGYRASSNPDLWVNFDLAIEQRVIVTDVPRTSRHPYMLGFHTTWERRVEELEEGTLVIDLADARRRVLVWTGSAQKVISRIMRSNPGPAVEAAVAAIFAEFPFWADG